MTKAYQKIPGNHQQYNAEYIQFHKFQTHIEKKVSSCIALEVVKTLKICHCALLFEYLYTVYVFNCNKNVENEGLKGKL